MKKKFISFFVFLIFFVAVFPIVASADIGPKPSVVIDFEGVSGQTYYVTLLSSVRSTGPYSAVEDGAERRYHESDEDYPAFSKFLEYQDADGYFFLPKCHIKSRQLQVWTDDVRPRFCFVGAVCVYPGSLFVHSFPAEIQRYTHAKMETYHLCAGCQCRFFCGWSRSCQYHSRNFLTA